MHIYQKSVDSGAILCTVADYVLLYTLICVKAKQFGVRITSLSLMINHFHILASFAAKRALESFMISVTSVFARKYNKKYGLSGRLFAKPYGSAPKVRPSKIADSMIYVAANGLNKLAAQKAEMYRWNFLKYAESDHPFSEEFDPLKASKDMLTLVKRVNQMFESDRYIDYKLFDSKAFNKLSEEERKQLVDIIIAKYNVIDYSATLQMFGNLEDAFRMFSMASGSEYDICDDTSREDYKHYYKMIKVAESEGYDLRSTRHVGVGDDGNQMDAELAERLCRRFRMEVGASVHEIGMFLHIPESTLFRAGVGAIKECTTGSRGHSSLAGIRCRP